jgi:hypothetical protein
MAEKYQYAVAASNHPGSDRIIKGTVMRIQMQFSLPWWSKLHRHGIGMACHAFQYEKARLRHQV